MGFLTNEHVNLDCIKKALIQWLFPDFDYLNNPIRGLRASVVSEPHKKPRGACRKDSHDDEKSHDFFWGRSLENKFDKFFDDLLDDQKLHAILRVKGGQFRPGFTRRIDKMYL